MGRYPAELETNWQVPDGTLVAIRPIRPEDADIERDFVRALSPSARYLRFMAAMQELTPAMLERFTQIDYDLEMALIAVIQRDGREIEIAVARYIMSADRKSCEFAIVVADEFQGRGLGQHLMLRLIDIARTKRLESMTGLILSSNDRMLALAESLGFVVEQNPEDRSITRVRLSLQHDG